MQEGLGMNKVFIGVVAALILALSGSLWALRSAYAKANALTAENKSLSASLASAGRIRAGDQKALSSSRASLEALLKQKAIQDEKLRQALAANPDWASQRVPDDVADALRLR